MYNVLFTDIMNFITNSTVILNFIVNAYGFNRQCYTISVDFSVDNICQYYTNFTDNMPINLQLRIYNETDLVSVSDSSAADIVILWPEECFIQPSTQSSTIAIASGVTATIVLATVTLIAVVAAICICQRKTKKKVKWNE